MRSMVADYANGIILENPTDKQLESRKNTLEKQIEGKDENGNPLLPEKELLKAKAQLEAVTNAIERKENNVEAKAPEVQQSTEVKEPAITEKWIN